MFIFLLYLLLNMKLTFSTIIIQRAGVFDLQSDDIALVFFLTVENTFDHDIHVSACSIKCTENDAYADVSDHMYLLGGDMGFVSKKDVQNITLIYPNLYLYNRAGKCLVSLHYETDQTVQEMRKEIPFKTPSCMGIKHGCNSLDQDPREGCDPVDCVIKYSSRRSFFNKEYKMCQLVPECAPNSVYNPRSNTCRKLHSPVCKSDLEMLEGGHFERCHGITNLVNFRCHHGSLNNNSGECDCEDGWTSNSCNEGAYHPSLTIYHMCNIGLDSWERANRQKLIMTIVALVIFAVAILCKMLIAVCILNWCCHFIKSRGNSASGAESFCGDEVCPYKRRYDDESEDSGRNRKIYFSQTDASSEPPTDGTADLETTENESVTTIGSK